MKVGKTHYNDTHMTDSNSLAAALLQKPAEIAQFLTFLGGREDKKFPLSTLTEGVGNVKSIDRDEYEYPVQGRITRTRPIAETPASTTGVGRGGQAFVLQFPDRWFIKQYILISPSGVQARIMKEPVPNGSNFDYTLQLVDPDPSVAIPSQDLTSGTHWGQLFAPVGQDFSRGNASNWSAPHTIKHKLTTFRKSYQLSGNAADFVMQVQLPNKSGGTSNLWMDYEEWQKMLQWKTEQEMLLWYAEQSYNENGITPLKDENGQPVIVAPGLLQQIVNKDTYSRLTANKVHNTIGDLFYGMTDAQQRQVTLYTGTGGKREFDRAMKEELGGMAWSVVSDGTFVTGSGSNLSLEGYFTSYRHVDGHLITVATNPLFDHGPVADSRRKHPESNFSMESYRMVFVDQSTYEGEPNVIMVNKEGREMLRWAVPGSVVPRGFDKSTSRASDIDGASVHFLKTGGVCLRRFDTSLDLQCVAA